MRPAQPPSADPDAITTEFPAVASRSGSDGTILWLILGGIVGIVVLAFLAGGLRTHGPGPPTTGDETATVRTSPPASSTITSVPVTPPRARDVLEVGAAAAGGLYFEVRRGTRDGDVVFAGTIANGMRRRFAIPPGEPLVLALAWAPSARVRVNGRSQPTTGTTETYTVTAAGLAPLVTSTVSGATSR